MQNTLLVSASARYEGSHSRDLAEIFERLLRRYHPTAKLVDRDLVADPPPHLTDEMIKGFFSKGELGERRIRAALRRSDQLTTELLNADCLVIATPMYNFNVPSTLKAWIDLVVRSGVTFEKVADGQLRGLCSGKKALILCSMGGQFANHQMNLVEPYLRLIGDFIGLDRVEFVYLEGTARADFDNAKALADAERKMEAFLKEV